MRCVYTESRILFISSFSPTFSSTQTKNEYTNEKYNDKFLLSPTNHGLIESNENLVKFPQNYVYFRNEFWKVKTFKWINELTTFALIINSIKWRCCVCAQADISHRSRSLQLYTLHSDRVGVHIFHQKPPQPN